MLMNGRTKGDTEGEYTFIGGPGCSVNDLCCVHLDLLEHVVDFKVLNEIFSDHMPISLSIMCL